jgi:tetratricopeptide (TPR) repeat protein
MQFNWDMFTARDPSAALQSMEGTIRLGRLSGGLHHEFVNAFARAAEALMRLGRFDEARARAQECLELALPETNRLESGYAWMVLAELEALAPVPNWEEVEAALARSLEAFTRAGAALDRGRNYLVAARLAHGRGEGEAERWLGIATQVFTTTGALPLARLAEELRREMELSP